jgi:hypothetical protein
VGPGAGPWCELAERVSRNLTSGIASMGGLLFGLCQSPDAFTPQQLSNAGIASRRFLKLAWQRMPRDSRLVILGLECVCRTFESDVAESALLIRQAIEAQHIADFGFEELFWLAKEAERLIPLDADLVAAIYCATFAHREESRELTAMVDSRILGLTSNRSQDYNMALHELARLFPTFLSQRPIHAVGALVSVMESFVAKSTNTTELSKVISTLRVSVLGFGTISALSGIHVRDGGKRMP